MATSTPSRAAASNGHPQHPSGAINAEATEHDALLPRKPLATQTSIRNYLATPLSTSHIDLILLACYTITGLLDSAATVNWGAFVSMQTGNSIYVGLGLIDPSGSARWVKSAVSIASFCIGSLLFSRFHRLLGGSMRRRWTIAGSFTLQASMIFGAALIMHLTPKPEPGDEHDLHWHVLLPVALVAAQSGGQTATSRALELGSLTSTVLTSIYCDLWSDQGLLAAPSRNVNRNRRAAAPVLLIFGAALGGLWSKTEIGVEGALWTAALMKMMIVVVWMLWKGEKKDGDDDDQ